MLELKKVCKNYKTKSGKVVALDNVSLSLPEKGMVFVIGKSGCGKTTLLNVIGGLDGIDGGEVLLYDKKFSAFSASEYDDYRNTFIGFIFQEYNLLPEFTVQKNIEIAMELQGKKGAKEEADAILNEMEIGSLKNRKISELSGGQRQRVAIARALVKRPRIILADEPTGALDSGTGEQVLEILKKLSQDKLIIVVSHDKEFAEKYADRIIRLVDGQVTEEISFEDNVVEENICEYQDELYVKGGADLTEEELKSVASAVKNNKKIQLVEKITYRQKKATDNNNDVKSAEKIKLKRSKMKLKSSLVLGVKALCVKPIRLFFTILLSVLAFAVFGLFDTVANFDTANVVNNLLQNTDTTISLYGEYVVNHEHNDKYQIKMNERLIDDITDKAGVSVKVIYDFENNLDGIVNSSYKIKNNFGGEGIDANVDYGNYYYTDSITGFIEFGADEIKGDLIGDFGYKLILGEYPTIEYDENDNMVADSLKNVAISTYVADSIKHYTQNGTYNGEKILAYKDLIDKELIVGNESYKIVGIIDCGKISNKYDKLKKAAALTSEQLTLAEDFSRIINSGAHKCLFMADGTFSTINSNKATLNPFYGGGATWRVDLPDYTQPTKKLASEFVYNYQEVNKEEILFFDKDKTELGKDEILVHPANMKFLYDLAIKTMAQIDASEASGYLTELTKEDVTISEKQVALEEFFKIVEKYGQNNLYQNIKLTKTSKATLEKTIKDLKVVGVYGGEYIVDDNLVTASSVYVFIMDEPLMSELDIFTEQGEYSRIIIDSNLDKNSAKTIADYIVKEQGLSLVWFENSALEIIRLNEATIRQGANLFLYASIILASFSVFMLFNYITTSILNKRQSVGVLRGLGARGKDVLMMFLCESSIIALICAVLASITTWFGCDVVNFYIIEQMNIAIPFALFGVRQVLFVFALSVLTAVIASIIPIIRITKAKPVNLIRRV